MYYLSIDNSETPNRIGNGTKEIISPYKGFKLSLNVLALSFWKT